MLIKCFFFLFHSGMRVTLKTLQYHPATFQFHLDGSQKSLIALVYYLVPCFSHVRWLSLNNTPGHDGFRGLSCLQTQPLYCSSQHLFLLAEKCLHPFITIAVCWTLLFWALSLHATSLWTACSTHRVTQATPFLFSSLVHAFGSFSESHWQLVSIRTTTLYPSVFLAICLGISKYN